MGKRLGEGLFSFSKAAAADAGDTDLADGMEAAGEEVAGLAATSGARETSKAVNSGKTLALVGAAATGTVEGAARSPDIWTAAGS